MIVTELFSKVPLFEGVSPEDRAALARAATLRTYRRGETIVLTRALLGAFSARLRRANATIEGLASLDMKSRLARYFRELAATRGRKAGGGWSVVVRPSQREIADTIGSSRETVSRTMSQMAAEQLIVPKGKAVYVKLDSPEAGSPPGGRPASSPG